MVSLHKQAFFFLHFLLCLLLATGLSHQASALTAVENPRKQAEQYLEEEIAWLQQAALQNDKTDIRLKQASSSLIQSVSIWREDGVLLFPDRDSSTRVYDYLFLNNEQRIKKLLASASPTAWEQHDISAETLLYCKQDSPSVCMLLSTNELLSALKVSKETLLPALFSNNSKTLLWLAFAVLCLLLLMLPVMRYRFLQQKAENLKADNQHTFTMGEMTVDPLRLTISRGELTTDISERDLKILTCLFEHPDEVVTKDALYNAGWGRDYVSNSRSLEQHIMTLRKKIDPERKHPSLIETVHGIGYRYPASQL